MKFLKTLLCSVVSLSTSVAFLPAHAQTRDDVIQQALNQGAHLVRCVNHLCHDEQTGEAVGNSPQDGAYLAYPDTPDAELAQNQTAKALKQSYHSPY